MATKKVSKAIPTAAPVAAKTDSSAATPAPAAEPAQTYAPDDHSIDARMWRLNQDHIRMGSRPKE